MRARLACWLPTTPSMRELSFPRPTSHPAMRPTPRFRGMARSHSTCWAMEAARPFLEMRREGRSGCRKRCTATLTRAPGDVRSGERVSRTAGHRDWEEALAAVPGRARLPFRWNRKPFCARVCRCFPPSVPPHARSTICGVTVTTSRPSTRRPSCTPMRPIVSSGSRLVNVILRAQQARRDGLSDAESREVLARYGISSLRFDRLPEAQIGGQPGGHASRRQPASDMSFRLAAAWIPSLVPSCGLMLAADCQIW